MSDAGVDKRRIADMAGHRTTRMIDGTYRHSLHAVLDASIEMEQFLGDREHPTAPPTNP